MKSLKIFIEDSTSITSIKAFCLVGSKLKQKNIYSISKVIGIFLLRQGADEDGNHEDEHEVDDGDNNDKEYKNRSDDNGELLSRSKLFYTGEQYSSSCTV